MQASENTLAERLPRFALLLGLIFLLSACAHSEKKEDVSDKSALYAFTIVASEESAKSQSLTEAQRIFLNVDAEGTITTQGDRVLGSLMGPLSVGKEGKLAFRLTEEGTIENDLGQVLDAQIQGDTLEFKGFMDQGRMRLFIDDEHLFVSVQSPDGKNQKQNVGRITPYRPALNDRVLWLAHYALLQSFKLFTCQAKQNMARLSLMSVRQHQEIFRLENGRYGRSLTEIAFQRNNAHYHIEVLTDDEGHYRATATSVPVEDATDEMLSRADVWTIDQEGTLENITDGCR